MSTTKKKRTVKAKHVPAHDDTHGPVKYGHRKQAAPLLDLMMDDDQVDDYQTLFAGFPDLKAILDSKKNPTGVDGKYGPQTEDVIQLIAGEAKISEADIPKINFREKKGELYEKFIAQMETHHKKDETPKQVVERIDTSAADAARAKAEADRLAKEAADKAARDAEDAKVPAEIRGTAYDPRNLKGLSQQQRYELALKGLKASDQIRESHDTPSLRAIHDELDESVRWANKHLGTNFMRPSKIDPMTDEALQALGMRLAAKAGITGAESSLLRKAETQAQLDAAVARGLEALDRTAFITRDSEVLYREVKQFEKKDMKLNKGLVDGIADKEMAMALEQVLRERAGLIQVTGGQSQVAGVGTPPPVTPLAVPAATTKVEAPARN